MRPWTRSIFLQLCFLLQAVPDAHCFFGLTSRDPVLTLTPNFEDSMRDLQQGQKVTPVDLCNMMVLQRKQKQQCRKVKGVAETLVRASQLSAVECQHQFQNERWNCSLGDYRKHILKKGFKETSFLYAISSAGIVHEISRACAKGIIDRCTCDESKDLENTETWRWGGCGDNIQFGMKFTRKFLHGGKRSEKDVRAQVDEHNSEAGIKVVKNRAKTKCKCHGVSGSCTVKTCWLQLSSFADVGSALKSKYEKSTQVIAFTNQAAAKSQLMKLRPGYPNTKHPLTEPEIVPLKKSELTYIEKSPNFCLNSTYSAGTSGRYCTKKDNCDSICCGSGYNVQKLIIQRPCFCKTIWCCELICETCAKEEEIYMCK